MMDVRILLIGATICLTQAYETSEPLHIVNFWEGGYDTDFTLHPSRFYNGWCIHIVMDQPVDCVLIWRADLVNTTHCKGNREFLAVDKWFDHQLRPGQPEHLSLQIWHSYNHTINGRVYLKDRDGCSGCLYSYNFPDYVSTGGPGYEKCTGKKSPTTTSTTKTSTATTTTTTTTTTTSTTSTTTSAATTAAETTTTTPTFQQNNFNTATPMQTSALSAGQRTSIAMQTTNLPGSKLNTTSSTSQNIDQIGSTGAGVSAVNNVTGHAITASPPSQVNGDHTRYNYSKALELSILFYDSQRSGKLPANNTILWRGDSATNDTDHGIDLTGGWYDAGDYMKFNFPMSASTTNLLWGLEKWKDGYKQAGQLEMMYDMVKWPLDYFLKCWRPKEQEYYVQVGDGPRDHAYMGRPEDMHMKRPSYKVTTSKPGSDVAGETVASLAAGSIVFKPKDTNYSSTLLDAAKSLYKFAKDNRGIYSESVPQANMYYGSFKYTDELCEGAAWLYKATKDQQYLQDAISFYLPRQPKLLNWEDKDISCQMLLYEITGEDKYKHDVQSFVKSYLPGGNISYTPCGLAFVNGWGPLRYSANAALIALLAAENGIGDDQYKQFAMSQINYMLGDNNKNISYEIGFGSDYPRHPYHRASTYNNAVLKGALVGGPDRNDNYQDKQDDYQKNEVACDYNAGFQSVLAGLIHFANNGTLPVAPPAKC